MSQSDVLPPEYDVCVPSVTRDSQEFYYFVSSVSPQIVCSNGGDVGVW